MHEEGCMDLLLYEGPAEKTLVVEARCERVDGTGRTESLTMYKRVLVCSSGVWVGRYEPWDEARDPEGMSDWRLCYDVELAAAAAVPVP
jgi:hypothetical protein